MKNYPNSSETFVPTSPKICEELDSSSSENLAAKNPQALAMNQKQWRQEFVMNLNQVHQKTSQ